MGPSLVDDTAITNEILLSDSLKRLQIKEQLPSSLVEPSERRNGINLADEEYAHDDDVSGETAALRRANGPPSPWIANVREGYGFRAASGPTTPTVSAPSLGPADGTSSPLPDPNGLGWPGQRVCTFCQLAAKF